ncbi:MAG: pantetheine-phosphate adenylyltransferase [Candidatus Shapirobacteria bacterium]|nr:pantetheine-phosphate adenylyltransferase [Candidatus Shapirobacteria bacterium]
MNKERKAVYAGSFDPPTNGHVWMIEQGSKLFDNLVVSIGTNPDKKYTFSVEERLEMLKESVKNCSNVSFDEFNNKYLVNYAKQIGADFILRGTRNSIDFDFEKAMNNVNQDIDSNIITVFLIPPRELCEISSSLVKGLIGPDGWEEIVCKYVPQPIFDKIKEKYGRK